MIRALPLRTAPDNGETLSSWLLRTADLHQAGPGDFIANGFPARVLSRSLAQLDVAGLQADELTAVGHVAGVEPGVLENTWAGLAAYTARVADLPGPRSVHTPTRFSPYCPACLGETGSWQSQWRVPWHDVCRVHNVRLVRHCPKCGKDQRNRGMRSSIRPGPGWFCDQPEGGATGRGDRRCGADLRTAATTAANDRLMRLVGELEPLLNTGSDDTALAATGRLGDCINVARLRLWPTPLHDADLDVPSLLADAAEILADAAAFAEVALADVNRRPSPLPAGLMRPSPALTARIVTVRDARLRPVDRLRWRSTTEPRKPDRGIDDARRVRRHIPRSLWDDWALRLCPPSGVDVETVRVASTLALLTAGSHTPLRNLAEHEHERGQPGRLTHMLSVLRAYPLTFIAITQLADALHSHGAPIDYTRRWHEFGSGPPLDAATWSQMCRRGGINPGGAKRLALARIWLWSALTGGSLQVLPDALNLGDATSSDYHQFLRCLTPEAAAALTDHAHQLLVQRSIDEPVSWSPPRDWVNAQLPGVEIDDLNPATLIERVRSGDASSDIAEDRGLPLPAVQALIHRHPPALHPRHRPNKARPRILPEHVTAEWLTDRRLAGATLRELAAELDVNRKTLSRVLEQADAPDVPRPNRVTIDPSWLREQYLTRGRTLPDIAAELGTTPTTIARRAKEAGIQLRDRGGGSHAAATQPTDHLPEPLRSALGGPNGQERLRRFQVVAHSRSINAAALRIGCGTPVLLQQLAAIERAVGQHLVMRSTKRHQAQRLTTTGRRLLHQVEDHFGAQPDSPPQHPEPLRSALDLYRGEYRVRRFVAVATAPTLAHAASRLRSDPSTLARLVDRLGERLEQPLLAAPPRARDQVRLTAAGKRLLEQARDAGLHTAARPEEPNGTPR